MHATRFVGLAVVAALAVHAAAQSPDSDRDDLLTVVSAALYPVQIMAYCYGEVAPREAFRDAGAGWNDRNSGLLSTLEDKAAAAGVPEAARRAGDARALEDIAAAVGGQPDKPAYCELIARYVEAGYYDIDRRADLEPALKRIFAPLP